MPTIKGKPISGNKFFALLCEDDEFCAQLGRAMLSAGRLETALKVYLQARHPDPKLKLASLGALLNKLKEHSLLEKMQPHIEGLKNQRNYLAHNIHPLLSDWLEESILERDVLDSDVSTYFERALETTRNLNALADIVERENSAHDPALQPRIKMKSV